MKTLLANMKRAARQGYVTPIGGGQFSPAELQAAIDTIEDMQSALQKIVKAGEAQFGESGWPAYFHGGALTAARAIVARMEAD